METSGRDQALPRLQNAHSLFTKPLSFLNLPAISARMPSTADRTDWNPGNRDFSAIRAYSSMLVSIASTLPVVRWSRNSHVKASQNASGLRRFLRDSSQFCQFIAFGSKNPKKCPRVQAR